MRLLSRRRLFRLAFLPVCLGVGLAALPAASRALGPLAKGPAGIRVVNCDQHVQSSKRGVCANELSEADFRLLAPGVSWFYNWHFDTKNKAPADVNLQFIPMAWGTQPATLPGLQSYLSQVQKKPPVVLAINEPNLRGQAFINPQQTADLYRKVKEITDRYNIPCVGPHMALGSGGNESIKANDPIQNKEVTYTFMVPFLKAFFHFLGNTDVPATAFHSYGNLGELKWATGLLNKEFGKPVWVTEFAQWKIANPEEGVRYAMQATDFLERTPFVAGYAWFKERVQKNPSISLLEMSGSKLTPIGEAYVNAPVHDADLYYRLPGRLQAESYVTTAEMEIQPTTDMDGYAFMESGKPQATLDYNVQVDAPGNYALGFRVNGPAGKIELLRGDTVLGTIQADGQPNWQTFAMPPVALAAGPQKLRVRCENPKQAINWIEFARR